MKRIAGIALALFAGAAFAQTQGVSKNEIVIGSMQDLSGPIVAFSKQLKNGMEMRVAEINAQGGIHGRKLKLIIEDHGYDPKKAVLGAGTKANHLSYVGDTTVGSKVNVGAVTVTCNYDGVNKHRTEIGDGVFIGSGTMLVAPVSVGADATIGAGSTITKPAPAGKLTVERGRQVTVENWKRPERKPK